MLHCPLGTTSAFPRHLQKSGGLQRLSAAHWLLACSLFRVCSAWCSASPLTPARRNIPLCQKPAFCGISAAQEPLPSRNKTRRTRCRCGGTHPANRNRKQGCCRSTHSTRCQHSVRLLRQASGRTKTVRSEARKDGFVHQKKGGVPRPVFQNPMNTTLLLSAG